MKRHPLAGLSRCLLPSFALISMALLVFGCGKGDTGPTGATGSSGSPGSITGTVSGNVKNAMSGNPVAGAAITVSPSVQGVSGITTDASGNYSVDLPNGNYTLTFAKNGYTSQTTGTIAVVATKTSTSNITLVPNASATVNAGVDKTGQAFGASVALSASVEVYDPSLTGAPTYAWTQTSGPAATITGATTATPTVTLANSSAFKANLVLANAVRMGLEPPGGGSAPDIPNMAVLDRFMVQPINPFSLEEGVMSTFLVTVTINGQKFTDSVNVSVKLPFAPTTGLRNVSIGQPVLLHGKTQASYNWTITSKPAGSTATLNDAATQNPDFIPDVAGKYTINETTGGSFDIYAGTWVGVIMADGTPDSACMGCHNGTTAPDKFTPWKSSGHAFIMTDNINNPAGHWSATSCGPCHTVGYKQFASTIKNGGWDEVSAVEGFKFTQGPLAWTNTLLNYPKTAKLSNIQCENCHGPQAGGGAHTLVSPRIDIAGSVCAYCHGEPQRHGRFQEWAESGHGDFETALGEGFSTSATTGVTTIRTSCAGCHTGQGFLQWYKQLANVGGGRKVGSRTLDATTLANLGWNSAGTLTSSGATVIQDAAVPGVVTKANVQPQTCAVCHDPHDEGTVTTTVPGGINDARVRVKDNTSLLPGGFIATGVGRGALCITCHNSRNGEFVSGAGNPTLHEDGDANWGTQVSSTVNGYNSPHEAAQGDVLMGRNAYYVTGARSRHSFLADTCVSCHMELTTPPAAFSGSGAFGTNHGFKASLDICTKCHGSFTGGTLQASFDARLAQLDTEIGKAVYRLANAGANPPASTTIVIVYGRSPTISINGAAAVSFKTYLTGATGATAGYHPDIAKANWNYSLVQLDSSKGIHNPSFTFDVLDATIAKMKTL
jgi:ribosomal protein L31